LTIREATLGTWETTSSASRGQATSTTILGFKFTTPSQTIWVKTFKMKTAVFGTASMQSIDIHLDAGGSPGSKVGVTSDSVNTDTADTVYTWTFSTPVELVADTVYWVVVTPASGAVSVNWQTVPNDAAYGSGRAGTFGALTDSLPNSEDWLALVTYDYDDAAGGGTPPPSSSPEPDGVLVKHAYPEMVDRLITEIDVKSTNVMASAVCLAYVPVTGKIRKGEAWDIYAAVHGTNDDVRARGSGIYLAIEVRIGEGDFTQRLGGEIVPIRGRAEWNLGVEAHHGYPDRFGRYVWPEDVDISGTMYAKLFAWSGTTNAQPGDKCDITPNQTILTLERKIPFI